MKKNNSILLFVLLLLFSTKGDAQSFLNGSFTCEKISIKFTPENNFNLHSLYKIVEDILEDIIWCEGQFLLQDSIIECIDRKGDICLKFQILDAVRLKLISSTYGIIDKKIYLDRTIPLEAIISESTIQKINECHDSVIFYRDIKCDTKGKAEYMIFWKNNQIVEVMDLKLRKPVQNIDSLLNAIFKE